MYSDQQFTRDMLLACNEAGIQISEAQIKERYSSILSFLKDACKRKPYLVVNGKRNPNKLIFEDIDESFIYVRSMSRNKRKRCLKWNYMDFYRGVYHLVES